MKNKKLTLILISSFVALCIVVGGVVAIFANLEKNPIGTDDTVVRRSGNDTVVFRDERFVTGNIVKAEDERLKNCVLLLSDQRGIKEVYSSKYAPLFGEVKTKYYFRNSGNIICEKTELEKSKYHTTAYAKKTFTLPELKAENIRRINICYGSYYSSTEKYAIDGVSDFFAATVDGRTPAFNLVKSAEIEDMPEIRLFLHEFNTTGALKENHQKWCERIEKENVFFQIQFADGDFPFSLLLTKEAINGQ